MSENRKWTTAAGGVFALAVLIGCGREPSVASKSAAAFQEAKCGMTLVEKRAE